MNMVVFANHLLSLARKDYDAFASDMNTVAEIRGRWWETERCNGVTTNELAECMCKQVAAKWGLLYVTD